MDAVTLNVPLPPNAANSRRMWRVALREKKEYWQALTLLGMCGALPKPPGKPFDPAHIIVHMHVWNIMDNDNAMARLKPLLDWMRGLYIGDDSPKRLKWEGLPAQSIDRRRPRVEVTVKPWRAA